MDAGSAVGMALMPRLELRPQDIVFVAAQPVTTWDRVIKQLSPNLVNIPLGQIN